MITRYAILVASCFLFTAQTFSQRTLTFDEVVNHLVFKSRELQMHNLAYANELLEQENYRKSFLPSLSLNFSPINLNRSIRLLQSPENGSYSNVHDYSLTSSGGLTISQKIGPTGGTLAAGGSLSYLREISRDYSSYSSSPFYLSYSQQLFGGWKQHKFDKTTHSLKKVLASKSHCSAIAAAQQRVASLFLAARSSLDEKLLAEETLKVADELVRVARVKLEHGKITQFDLNQLLAEQISDSLRFLSAANDYAEALSQLKDFLRIDEDVQIALGDMPPLPQHIDLETARRLMMENSPTAQNRTIEKVTAEQTLYQAKLDSRWNASISLSYGLNKYATEFGDILKHPDRRQSIDVTVSFPVFQWGINNNKRQMAENNYKSALLSWEQSQEDMDNNIRSQVFQYNLSVSQNRLAATNYDLAREQYRLACQRFAVGNLSATDLVSANRELFSAQHSHADAFDQLLEYYFAIRSQTLYDFVNDHCLTFFAYDNSTD